jgi:CBS domain-containing protein
VTGTDLLDALALGAKTPDCPVAEVATRDLITCQANDFLFNALIVMTRKHIKRVVITDQGQVVGVSELTDILSYLTGQTHLMGVQIEKAKTVEDLKHASKALNALIRALNAKGVKIRFMMELLAALNGRLVAKLFETTMPKHVLDNTALTVLGSEVVGSKSSRLTKIMRSSLRTIRLGRSRAYQAVGSVHRGLDLDRFPSVSRKHHGE